MKIVIFQADTIWGDPAANLKHLDEKLATLPECGLLVLPEMFTTGFATDPEGIAEKEGLGLAWMKKTAAAHNCCIIGSIATELPESVFRNRMYFVTPKGETRFYDKRHLFAAERKKYSAGDERVIVEVEGVRIMMQVCYDLRFPCFSRNRIVDGRPEYDMLVYVASWPQQRSAAWKALLRARAIENQCWLAGVNRCGNDPGNGYTGDSVVLDPWGADIAACAPGVEEWALADIDMTVLEGFRKSFPVLEDADR